MTHQKPLAIVTGANRGIGLEVSRQLAEQDYTVLLTARSLLKAQNAAAMLSDKNLVPAELDVADPASIAAFLPASHQWILPLWSEW